MLPFLLAASLTLAAPSEPPARPALGAAIAVAALPADSMKIREAELKAAIDSGIAMLRAKDCLSFLKRFISPDQVEEVRESGGVEQLAEAFKVEKADPLLGVLKAIRKKKPSYDTTGMRATFKLPKGAISRGAIEFERIDGLWYIRN